MYMLINTYSGGYALEVSDNCLYVHGLKELQIPGTEVEEENISNTTALNFQSEASIDYLMNALRIIKYNMGKHNG